MENPYSAPQGEIFTPVGSQAPLTWKQIIFSFEGRIPRRTYWGFSILLGLISFALQMLAVLGLGEQTGAMVSLVFSALFLWPSLAITTKRWHDRDKSGWWFLIILIPFVGVIWFFVEVGCLRGTQGANKYGEDPT